MTPDEKQDKPDTAAPADGDQPTAGPAETRDADRPRATAEGPGRQPPAARGADRPVAATPRRGSAFIAALALLLSLVACAAVGWRWWQDREAAQSVAEAPDWQARIDRATSEFEGDLGRVRDELQQAIEQQRGELQAITGRLQRLDADTSARSEAADRLEASLRQELRALERRFEVAEATVNQLASLSRDSEDELRLAEAEFLMRLAAERLALFDDPAGALTALQLAADYLRAVDDPLYTSAREALAREIQRLQAVEMPDRAAISGRLLQLAEAADSWPLDQRRTVEHSGNWLQSSADDPGWLARTRDVLSSLIVVHRDTGNATVMLTLEEQQLLRENVRLQLQVAQLAAVRGEAPLYQAALTSVQGWLEDYFDAESTAVRQGMGAVSELREVDVDPPLPDLGDALRELRGLRSSAQMSGGRP